jgi:hypothetical protein
MSLLYEIEQENSHFVFNKDEGSSISLVLLIFFSLNLPSPLSLFLCLSYVRSFFPSSPFSLSSFPVSLSLSLFLSLSNFCSFFPFLLFSLSLSFVLHLYLSLPFPLSPLLFLLSYALSFPLSFSFIPPISFLTFKFPLFSLLNNIVIVFRKEDSTSSNFHGSSKNLETLWRTIMKNENYE